jgi:hypothetical protein
MGSGGGLDPVASIRMIEMATKGNPEQMQSGFGAYDDCKPDGKNTDTLNRILSATKN